MSFVLDEHGHAVTVPLKNVSEVLQWIPDTFSSVPIRRRNKVPAGLLNTRDQCKTRESQTRPQVLMCHDMCGGYLEDRYSHGCSKATAYRFCHWQLIDIFIYFSHHFVTIPPIGWIRSAHKHGVAVLGTIITEWGEGAELCKEILKSEESIDQFTDKMAQLAQFHGFDGWLINIENKIEADKVPLLQRFVEQLTNKCRRLLEVSKVLWYDSVIDTGELKWQDELNTLNEMFFTVSDGIFLNYCITEEKLARSKCSSSASGREVDVFVGIDVFGRGTPGGGGFNTKETLKLVLDHGLSCAIFAPGWTYENLGPTQFDSNEVMFWGILGELLAPRPVEVPFATSFCQGYGERCYLWGKVISDLPWYNLSLQQVQPSFTKSQFVSYTVSKIKEPADSDAESQEVKKDKFRIETESHGCHPANPEMMFDTSVGHFGGGSLKVTAKMVESLPVIFRMFLLKIQPQKTIHVSVTLKIPADSGYLFGIVLSVSDAKSEPEGGSAVVCTKENLDDKHREMIRKELQKFRGPTQEECPSVHFVTGARVYHNDQNVEGEWVTCIYSIDVGQLVQKSSKNDEFILSAVLIPSDKSKTGSKTNGQMSAHIGYLQVLGDSDVILATEESSVKNLKCLEVKVNRELSKEETDLIVMHPCFGSDGEHLKNTRDKSGSEHSSKERANIMTQDVKHLENMREISGSEHSSKKRAEIMTEDVKQMREMSGSEHLLKESAEIKTVDTNTETQVGLSSPGKSVSRYSLDLTSATLSPAVTLPETSYTLYVLRWEVQEPNVDVCLVYSWDESGAKSFIGHAVRNWFVWKQANREKKVLRFSIQPVISLSRVSAEEVYICV